MVLISSLVQRRALSRSEFSVQVLPPLGLECDEKAYMGKTNLAEDLTEADFFIASTPRHPDTPSLNEHGGGRHQFDHTIEYAGGTMCLLLLLVSLWLVHGKAEMQDSVFCV